MIQERFEVGDLVRDKLNEKEGSYGLGIVIRVCDDEAAQEWLRHGAEPPKEAIHTVDVYFTKFRRSIAFHGTYLERV